MNFYLSRNGTVGGPYSKKEIYDFQSKKQLFEKDLIWAEKMDGWITIEDYFKSEPLDSSKRFKQFTTAQVYRILGFRVLDRYILKELSLPFVASLAGIYIFIITYDIFVNMSGFLARGVQLNGIVKYYLLQSPQYLLTILPACFFLSLLYAFTQLKKSYELVAMQSAGIGRWRILRPIMILALLFGVLEFALGNFWVPRIGAMLHGGKVITKSSQIDELESLIVKPLYVMNHVTKSTISGKSYNIKELEIEAPTIDCKLLDGEHIRLLPAPLAKSTAKWKNGKWECSEMILQITPTAEGIPRDAGVLISTNIIIPGLSPKSLETACWFQQLNKKKQNKSLPLTFAQIKQHRENSAQLAGTMNMIEFIKKLEVEMHSRMVMPWVYLLIALITAGIFLRQRSIESYVLVVKCMGGAGCLFLFQQLGEGLSIGGAMPTFLGVWAPNVLGALSGVYLVAKP